MDAGISGTQTLAVLFQAALGVQGDARVQAATHALQDVEAPDFALFH